MITYARARLWLGITGVGTLVTLSILALIFQLPQRLLGGWPSTVSSDLAGLGLLLGAYALISLPFDWLGGWLLPKRYGRPVRPFSRYLVAWLRGVLVQGLVMLGIGLLTLAGGRAFGVVGAVTVVTLAMLVLLTLQFALARLVGALPRRRPPAGAHLASVRRPDVLAVADVGFVGGWTGWPGFERLVVPYHWVDELTPEELELQMLRREAVLASGGRALGVWIAVAWNLAGFGIAVALVGGVTHVTQLVTIALYMTIWSFIGLLVLPSLSRPGVYAADAYAKAHSANASRLPELIRKLDRWQDDEPRRAAGIEVIFHPIPAAEHRADALQRECVHRRRAWHTARMALPLSWATLGLLGRAVHCDAGRPELWVMLPGD